MKINEFYIQQYLQKGSIVEDAYFKQAHGYHSVSKKRKEVVQALLVILEQYQEFPLWNRTVIKTIFQNDLDATKNITIYPVVGLRHDIDCMILEQEQETMLMIDLLHIADYTCYIHEMEYILHNLMHKEILRWCMQKKHPQIKEAIHTHLEAIFYQEGLIEYICWNADISTYPFQLASYTKRKEQAFAFLYQAMQGSSAQIKDLIAQLSKVDLWKQFPTVAGMFFLDDLYQAYGEKGLKQFYEHGYEHILDLVFPK